MILSRQIVIVPFVKGFFAILLLSLLMLGCTSQSRTAEGIRYYGQAQYDAALSAFQSVLQTNPDNPDVLYNVAVSYHQSAKALLRSGQTAAAQQQYDQSAQYYQQCLARDANHAEAHRGLAALYMDCKNAESAFTFLINWYNTQPLSAEPKLELARLYQEYAQICTIEGRTDVAQQCLDTTEYYLQQVLAADSSNFRALRALGYLKEQRGDVAGAVLEYQRSLQFSSQPDLEDRIAALIK